MSVEKIIDEQNNLSKRINNAINKINLGIPIDTRKICPLLSKQCIGDECLGFRLNYNINVVSWEESLEIEQKFLESGNKAENWIEELLDDDWQLYAEIIHPRLSSLDETTYIFQKNPINNTFGRCISLGRV